MSQLPSPSGELAGPAAHPLVNYIGTKSWLWHAASNGVKTPEETSTLALLEQIVSNCLGAGHQKKQTARSVVAEAVKMLQPNMTVMGKDARHKQRH